MRTPISVLIFITLLLSLTACSPASQTARLELYNNRLLADATDTYLVGRVLYIGGGLGEKAPFLTPVSFAAHRIPEGDQRKAPSFNFDEYLANKYKYVSLGGEDPVRRVDPGRYLVEPVIGHPFYLKKDNKISYYPAGALFTHLSEDYLGEIAVHEHEAVYFGDVLMLEKDGLVLGVMNNLDRMKASLERTHPDMAKRLRFRPFTGPHFRSLSREQAAKILNNLADYIRVKIVKYAPE